LKKKVSDQECMDANLMERLELFHDSGQIDTDIYQKVPGLVQKVEGKLEIELAEENAGQFVSHLAIALQRIKSGQTVQESPQELLVLTEKYPELYTFAKEILGTEEEAEALFITIYFCTLTGKGD
jgi:transcriptional regulatory protein LevR